MDLGHENIQTIDLFGNSDRLDRTYKILQAVDGIDARFGKHTVYLGSSSLAMTRPSHRNDRADVSERRKNLFKGESGRKRIGLPFMGRIVK